MNRHTRILLAFLSMLFIDSFRIGAQSIPSSVAGAASPCVISEFMAANVSTLADEEGDFPDWIELLNTSAAPLNLDGWFLTDDSERLTKWRLPATNLAASARLVVFASGKNRAAPGARLHANFSLDADGEFLALVRPDGVTVASAFAPAFPKQRAGISFGLVGNSGTNGFLATPTPGAANVATVAQFAADTKFSHDRGFYEAPFSLVITCATPGVQIRFTTNGAVPGAGSGQLYSAPISIRASTVIRARAERAGFIASDVDTHTYLFVRDVIRQSPNGGAPPGWPARWGENVVDYGMDPDIVNRAPWNATITNDLRALPAISLVTTLSNWFDAQRGIYANPGGEGRDWERPGSIELIYPDGRKGFASPTGLRIRGGFSRSTDNPKHSFRVVFREAYGAAKLRFPFFGPTGASAFDRFDFRTSQDGSYAYLGDENGLFLTDPFSRDTLLALGQPGERGDWYHLYLNGQYWGVYNSCERPEANFASSYLGGAPEDWDVLKPDPQLGYVMKTTDGDDAAWIRLWRAATNGFASNTDYFRVQGRNADGSPNPALENLLDVTNLVDYLLVIFWAGNFDGPLFGNFTDGFLNNYYAYRDRLNRFGGFRFCTHDAELSLLNVDENRVNTATTIGDPRRGHGPDRNNPYYLWTRLLENAEFRVLVADRIQRHFFGGGALTREAGTARFVARVNELNRGMVGESARWGDAKRPTSPITHNHWTNAIFDVVQNYFPRRQGIVLEQLRDAGLWPALAAPEFSPTNAEVTFGEAITLAHTNAAGAIFYTLDGTDPRALGGGIAASAVAYSSQVTISGSVRVRARVRDGAGWSPLVEADYFPAQRFDGLRVTEIMFHPPPFGASNGEEDEFLELKNTGTNTLDLGGCFFRGIAFAFPHGTQLAPGQFFVLARNATNFAAKYPGVTANGIFSGRLDNGGERVTLHTGAGAEIFGATFGDRAPWPITADGHGFSLVPRDVLGLPSPDDGTKWRASAQPGGSPDADDPAPNLPVVWINEVLPNPQPPALDAIELWNPNVFAVDVSGWWLTDDATVPRKFRIPNGTVIAPGSYATLGQAQFGDTNSPTAFALDADGDEVYLLSASATSSNLTGFSHGVRFGASAIGVSFGRYVNSAGEEQFPAQLAATFGAANSGPRFGPAVISEIHYHPLPGYDEFVEIQNISAAPLRLSDATVPTNTWRIDGLGFDFPPNITLPAGGFALVVATNPAAFRTKYSVPAATQIFGPFLGALQDSGERLELQQPTPPGTNGRIAFITIDAVRYNDRAPWSVAADGDGPALQRRVASAYGDDPTNWFASGLTPGRANRENRLPTVTLLSPTNGAIFTLPTVITLEAGVNDVDGSVALVEFFDGALKLGQATNAPWRFAWSTASPGSRVLSVKARDNELGSAQSAPVVITIQPPAIGSGIGLRGEYFDNADFTGARIARLDATVNFSWPDEPTPGLGADTFTVRWTGRVQPISSGTYTFHVVSAGGARLWLDGVQRINHWTDHAQAEDTATLALETGRLYDLRLEYVNDTGLARVELAWSAAGLARQTIPRAQLYPPANPANQPPTVVLTAPADQSALASGNPLLPSVNAGDPDGALWKVRFVADGTTLGESFTAPFDFTWALPPLGRHELRAVAFDDSAVAVTSAPVTLHVVSGFTSNETLISFGATWRYWDRGPGIAPNWAAPAFSDAGWSNGPAQLGYGDNDEATVVSFGPDSAMKYNSTYFRRAFNVASPETISALTLRMIRDDGVLIHINGSEEFRDNMPAGPVDFATVASRFISGGEESTTITGRANPGALRAGVNLLAAEIHQGGFESSDISFDLELTATRNLLAPYVITPPISVATNVGASVSFTVIAGGTAPLSYQWRRNGGALPGATSATLSLGNVQPAHAASYTVVIANSLGTATSAVATLTFAAGPALTIVAANNGRALLRFVSATGRNYEVQTSPNLSTWTALTNLPGSSGVIEVPVSVEAEQQHFFRLRVIGP